MNHEQLFIEINRAEQFAATTKIIRFLRKPLRYGLAVGFRQFFYPFFKSGMKVSCRLITGHIAEVVLPSATDLYLAGCKTDASEIRLTRFLTHFLKNGDVVLDAGAHVGFYSLLASTLVGPGGKVIAVEASPAAFTLLQHNTKQEKNIILQPAVLGSTDGEISFYEFPVQYAEYNSVDIRQYEQESWFASNPPVHKKLKSTKGDILMHQLQIKPSLIKMDVEGNEAEVIKGLTETIRNCYPAIVMEYVSTGKEMSPHRVAENLLFEMGYRSYSIQKNGETVLLKESTEHYVAAGGLRSDNILYLR